MLLSSHLIYIPIAYLFLSSSSLYLLPLLPPPIPSAIPPARRPPIVLATWNMGLSSENDQNFSGKHHLAIVLGIGLGVVSLIIMCLL